MNRVDNNIKELKEELAEVEHRIEEINDKRKPAYSLAKAMRKNMVDSQKEFVHGLENYLYDELKELHNRRYKLIQDTCSHPLWYEMNKTECKCIRCGKVENSSKLGKNIVKDNALFDNYYDYANKYYRLEEQGLNEEDIVDALCIKNKVKVRKK